jgi:hypothetical protein
MEAVQAQVLSHYRSELVDRIRARGGVVSAGGLTIKLAKEFGFCYGVERAIDLAYAARKAYPDKPIYILGEIIHNPEVNDQIRNMGIKFLSGKRRTPTSRTSRLETSSSSRRSAPRLPPWTSCAPKDASLLTPLVAM